MHLPIIQSSTMNTWSELLPEILNTIARKLDFYEDYINFLCVCTSWNNSSTTTTKNLIKNLPSKFPMMFAESNTTEDPKHRTFFLLSNGSTMRNLPLPEAHRQRCISTHGWLLTTGEQEFYTKLVNPLSHTQIKLPELYMFEELYFDRDEWMYYGFCMRKAVFTSSNPLSSDPSFRVIIIWGKSIGFCRPGDGSWTLIDDWEGNLFDIAYHTMRKRLYVVATMGDNTRILLMVTRERHHFKKQDDEYGRYGPYRTSRFQCFVYGLDDGKWSKSASLGGKPVFLGFNLSFAVDGGEGVKQNCVYFTDDLYEPYCGLPDGGGGDVGVYHMVDGRIESVFDSQESVFRGSPPPWLQPSTLPVIKGMKKLFKDV
ncbi:hypothetical protein L1987_62858 [Smallanthus sonchifolius]|uniref:Uncharacterized protein n=1 Tax=Smallanthus sonchifolius TaxID=185202 RepID=A0ACB9CBM2_9ASTR|nr:hypothetical protein L1987_62858 [Smallanthus sonchifolius]